VKFSLSLTKHRTTKAYGVEVQLHAFLISAQDEDEWSASRPSRFTPEERASRIHWRGDWVGPKDGMDAVAKRKNPTILPAANRNRVVQTKWCEFLAGHRIFTFSSLAYRNGNFEHV